MRRATILLLFCILPLATQAQEPRDRPKLPANSDVNDPLEFMRLGESMLESAPDKAEKAFYWASRLAPGSADLLYGRYVARLLSDKGLLIRLWEGERRALRSKDMIALDSLRLAFHTADPFLFGRHDKTVLMTYLNELIDRDLRRSGANVSMVDRAEIDFYLNNVLRQSGSEMRGWLAYTERRFADALAAYAAALKGTKDKAGLHSSRALALYHSGQYDEAIGALKSAVDERSKEDKDKLVHIYESQATYEYMIGRALEAKRDWAGAREAYSRALLSELSYYPAHIRVGTLSLVAGDTAAALSSFKTALDIQPRNGWIRSVYGHTLLLAGKLAEAATELKQATVLEPWFAAPYHALGRVSDLQNNRAEAVDWYRKFLERASQRDTKRAEVEARLREAGS
jgi:tetratricopeptide (TPR) repeat protein